MSKKEEQKNLAPVVFKYVIQQIMPMTSQCNHGLGKSRHMLYIDNKIVFYQGFVVSAAVLV